MNKKDVLGMVEEVALAPIFNGYSIRKSDNSIILKTNEGYKRVQFWHYNSYDLARDGLALKVRPGYDVRFNVLHKWFEKYSKRSLKDQRDSYSVGFNGGMIGCTDEFFFLENRKDYDKDLGKMKQEVITNAERVFSKFSTLGGYYEYCVDDVLKGKRELPDEGFEWVLRYLIATRLVAPSNYGIVKEQILQRVEYMKGRNNPSIRMYYAELPTILSDLEQTDFASGKWG